MNLDYYLTLIIINNKLIIFVHWWYEMINSLLFILINNYLFFLILVNIFRDNFILQSCPWTEILTLLAHIFIKSEQCKTAISFTMLVHSVLFCPDLFPFTERVNFSWICSYIKPLKFLLFSMSLWSGWLYFTWKIFSSHFSSLLVHHAFQFLHTIFRQSSALEIPSLMPGTTTSSKIAPPRRISLLTAQVSSTTPLGGSLMAEQLLTSFVSG